MISLTEQDKTVLKDAVQKAESQTTGEIVPMVVSTSDVYPGARWRVAVGFTLLSTAIALPLLPHVDAQWLLLAQFPVLLMGHLLGTIPAILRLGVTRAEKDEETLQRAFEAFLNNNVHATKERTGVLIFVSLLEHRIHVVADEGINARVEPDTWSGMVAALSARIKGGELAKGLEAAVLSCGELLAQHFPRKEDTVNELPNKVLTDEN